MKYIFLIFIVLFSDVCVAVSSNTHKAGASASVYQDSLYNVINSNMNYNFSTTKMFRKAGTSSFGISVNNKAISLNKTDTKSLDMLGGEESINVIGGTFSYDQNLGDTTGVGVFAGMQDSPVNSVQNYGVRFSQWWLHETIQTVLEYRSNHMTQESLDFTDVDGRRIITPEEIEGNNVNVAVTQFATTSTILKYGASLTTRSDRPSAWSAVGEIRQYITPFKGALHLNYGYYDNTGKIQPITEYGSVTGHSATASWHQKIGKQTMFSGGYRFHYETETPRADVGVLNHVGSDYYFTSMSYRLNKKPWSQSSSEVSAMAGYYNSNAPEEGYIFGLGLTYFL